MWGCVSVFEFLQICVSGGDFVGFFVCFGGDFVKVRPKVHPCRANESCYPSTTGLLLTSADSLHLCPTGWWFREQAVGECPLRSTASPEGSCFSNYLLVLGGARKKMEPGESKEAGKAIGRGWVAEN